MDVGIIITVIGSVAAIVGSNIALIGWLRADMKSFESEVRGWKDEVQKEMKEFHTRLATQDLEFKMRLCAIEERNKKS